MKKYKCSCTTCSWIPISVQSFISISYPVFEIHLSKLNNNNFENRLFCNYQLCDFKPFFRYMLFVTIPIRLICQKWDLIETETETYKSQMYGNAGQPVTPY